MLPLTKRSIELGAKLSSKLMTRTNQHGLIFRSLGIYTRSFIYLSVSYAGKTNTVTKTYITKVDLIIKIADGYETFRRSLNGANITMDRYYTSILVAKQLLKKNITIHGTLTANKKALPSAMKETKEKDENSWSCCKSNNSQLNSYVVKIKSSGYIEFCYGMQ